MGRRRLCSSPPVTEGIGFCPGFPGLLPLAHWGVFGNAGEMFMPW